jgi:hypothetical protein
MDTTLTHMPNPDPLLCSAYRAFNARDIDAALNLGLGRCPTCPDN